MSEVDHGYKLACDLLVHAVCRNRTAEHQISFNGVTDRLVCEYAREVRMHHNISVSRVRIYALCFFHKVFIKHIYAAEKLLGGGEYFGEESASAEYFIKFNIRTVLGLGG